MSRVPSWSLWCSHARHPGGAGRRKDVVLLGCGPIGLMAAGIAKAQGANQIISSEA